MKQLPPSTVRLLSSSQVITSVVNVVKELTENALDAEATSVDVKLENFGLDRIEVRDNGVGIGPEDAPLMGCRYFTSKICSHSDLEKLQSYGFRGEALGSICAVAQVSVITKTKAEEVSAHYCLDHEGNITAQKPSHLGQGTTVCAVNLFRNLPVRRQIFSNLKKRKEELRRVQDLLLSYAIIKPELRVTLYHNKTLVWQKSKMADHRSALVATLGPSVVSNLQPIHHLLSDPEIILDGFLPKLGSDLAVTSSSSPDKTFIYINDRPVQHKEILKLVRQHFLSVHSDEARSRFPVFVLRVCVSAADVDVNLTPDKTQVLLHHKEAVLTALEDLLVSLYGSQTSAKVQHTEDKPGVNSSNTSTESTKDLQEDSAVKSKDVSDENPSNLSKNTHPKSVSNKEIFHCQASNSSSSSSIAEDWAVNQIPANFNIFDEDGATQNCKNPDRSASETLRDDLEPLSAEDWSRGTALREADSNKPLQPVTVLCPSSESKHMEASSSPKPVSNAIIEKRAGLTGYDVLANRAVRSPLSPAALFERETRAEVVSQNPKAGLHQIDSAVRERWKNLSQEERQRFEDRAQKHLQRHEETRRGSTAGQKRKAPALSNQQLLDQLFSAQPQKKLKNCVSKASRTVRCSMASLRQNLLSLSSSPRPPEPPRPSPVSRLASQGCWLLLEGRCLLVMNLLRVEEALLFRRLMENNVLPAVELKEPIQLTEECVSL